MTTRTEEPSTIEDVMALGSEEETVSTLSYAEVLDEDLPVITISEMGKTVDVPFEDGMTIQQAMEAAEVDSSGFSIRLNGADHAGPNQVLQAGDTVLLAREVRGAFGEHTSMSSAISLGSSGVRLNRIIEEATDEVEDQMSHADLFWYVDEEMAG